MKSVTSKLDFVKRYKQGEFGNAGPTWSSVHDWLQCPNGHGTEGWNGPKLFHLRNKIAGGATFYDLTVNQLLQKLPTIPGSVDDYYVTEMAPHYCGTVQGNVMRFPNRLVFEMVPADLPMRDAIAKYGWTKLENLTAKLWLEHYLNPMSYSWLNELLDEYDDHIIEFSAFENCWGTVPGHNACFWEVRKY